MLKVFALKLQIICTWTMNVLGVFLPFQAVIVFRSFLFDMKIKLITLALTEELVVPCHVQVPNMYSTHNRLHMVAFLFAQCYGTTLE